MTQLGSPKKALSRVFGAILIVTTIAVTPWATIDPINLIKLMTLSTGALGIGTLILFNFRDYLYRNARAGLVLASLFVAQLILVFFLSSFDKALQFFGTMGRNTGLLFYLSLMFVLLGGIIISGSPEYRKSIYIITGVGVVSACYGLIQYLDLDPINWANKYSPIIGFLGNPNFQSSLLGLSAIGALVILLDDSLSMAKRIFSAVFIVAALFIAAVSNSQQGLLVFALGFACLAFFKIKALKNLTMTYSFVFALASASLVSLIGFFNKGPLSGLLYQASVTYRGDYWRAGWNMALDNPVFGVGLDAYGDNYRRYRTLEATLRRGPDVISNAVLGTTNAVYSGGNVLLQVTGTSVDTAVKVHKVYIEA
jgi:O-antigen ligase